MSNGKQRDTLTNEYLTKHFADNFSLALTSIEAARGVIESGREFRLTQLLESVAKSRIKEDEVCVSEECSIEDRESQEETEMHDKDNME